jgi:C_GCAxxG_C_C family probable redox protein
MNTKNDRTEKTLVEFRGGLNCAQAVFTAYADDLDLDRDLALNISCGFGAGMGRLQETCGAVTGAFMVLSIYSGKKHSDNVSKKAEAYSLIQKFDEEFKQLNGSSNCKSLIKCDLRSEEGHNFAVQNNLFRTVCDKCVSDALSILSELIEK